MDDVRTEVVALATGRVIDGNDVVETDEVPVYGPFMAAFLEPGEYGCALTHNDTVDMAWGHVYHKREDGDIEVVDSVADETEGENGRGLVRACAERYGFVPMVRGKSAIVAAARARDEPFVRYRDVQLFERYLAREGRECHALESTAYECEGCGAIAFEVLDLEADALDPDERRADAAPDFDG